MNQAPQPPTPQEQAARLDADIANTASQVSTLEGTAAGHELAAEAAAQQAEEADMRRSEVAAQAAALGVNAVVNTHELLSAPGRKFASTHAESYDVQHPEAGHQKAGFQEAGRDGRSKFWTGTSPQHATLKHNTHEGARARALGMEDHNHYPWHRLEKGLRGAQDLVTRGPARLRKDDPHEKQLQTDFHPHHENNVMHRPGFTSTIYRGVTGAISGGARKLFRRGDPAPEPRASDHETVTVSDAFALSADRIGQEVRNVTQGEDLPDRVAHRKTLGWPGLVKPGQTSHVDIPGLAQQEIGDLYDQLNETNRRRYYQGQAPLSFEAAYGVQTGDNAAMAKRLSKEDEALVGTGKHVHQLAFGERDAAEQQKLMDEWRSNRSEIVGLQDPTNIRPEEQGVDFRRYQDTLYQANGATLRQVADLRLQRQAVENALRQPGLSPSDQRALYDRLSDIQDSYEAVNGVQLTRDQEEVARRGIRYNVLEPRYQAFKAAEANFDTAQAELDKINDAIAKGSTISAKTVNAAQAKRDTARALLDTEKDAFDPVRADFELARNVRGAVARRNEIIELDSRKRQIDIVLGGGVQHDPNIPAELRPYTSNQANRKDVLDYFTDTAERQIDVAARRAAFDAMGPGANDSLGREAAELRKQEEEGMLLFAPPDGRRDTPQFEAKLRAFLGQRKYNALQQSLAGAQNGARVKLLNATILERVREIQRGHQTVLGEIRDHTVRQDGLLNEERILLPGILRAVAARPKVMRKGVETQEEAMRSQLAIAQREEDEAVEQRRRAADARNRLASLQAARARLPV